MNGELCKACVEECCKVGIVTVLQGGLGRKDDLFFRLKVYAVVRPESHVAQLSPQR